MNLLVLVSLVAGGSIHPAPLEDLYIGTYTNQTGAKGVYALQLDSGSGKLSAPELAATARDPSYVAIHPNRRFGYAIDESSDSVSAYAIGADRRWTLLDTVHGIGSGPCDVSVSHDGRTVLTAGYGGGTLASLPVRPDGSLGPVATLIQDHGTGPNRARQEGPHMHIAVASIRDRFAFSCDLGTDSVEVFRLDTRSATVERDEAASTKAPEGGGPRHIALYPNGRLLFADNEMGGSVTSYSIDPRTGALHQIQTVSTLPEGASADGNTTAEIVLHPNARWLYVSNRGNDSIAIYAVSPAGRMQLIDIQKLDVRTPRGFDIDPAGRWLVVAGQSTNDLSVYAVDAATGKLSPTGQHVPLGTPVCVAFVR